MILVQHRLIYEVQSYLQDENETRNTEWNTISSVNVHIYIYLASIVCVLCMYVENTVYCIRILRQFCNILIWAILNQIYIQNVYFKWIFKQ